MHSVYGCSDVNERLLTAVHNGNYEDTLSCLMQGAKATAISYSCGRTAVGLAALMGDSEILQLLIQSCEEPDLEIFRQGMYVYCCCFKCHLTLIGSFTFGK